jgi:serine protease Do
MLLGLGSGALAAKDYSDIFQSVDSAVVLIHTEEVSNKMSTSGIVRTKDESLGSGSIISADGRILTAAHVVHSADKVSIELKDGRMLPASVISTVVAADLALVQIDEPPEDLIYVSLGNSDDVRIGEEVFVVGSPYGLKHTLTVGHLSGRRTMKDPMAWAELEFLQTDAAINHGNSGGPLFSPSGKLIGVVSHIKTKGGGNEGLGFAGSINMAREMILNHPPLWSGVRYILLPQEVLRALNIPYATTALLIQHVAKGSLGDKLGLRAGIVEATINEEAVLLGGDVLIKVGDDDVYVTRKGIERVSNYFNNMKSGDPITVTVFREGKLETLSALKP